MRDLDKLIEEMTDGTKGVRTPPSKPPPMHVAAYRMAKVHIPIYRWPCVQCWGEGCEACEETGLGTRPEFYGWYRQLLCEYQRGLREYEDQLDLDARERSLSDYYDLKWLGIAGLK